MTTNEMRTTKCNSADSGTVPAREAGFLGPARSGHSADVSPGNGAGHAPLLEPGEKIHVMHRRRFEKDVRRHFVGRVERYEQGVVRATGYVFVTDDLNKHAFVRRPERRTKLIPVASGDVIVNVIPPAVELERVVYRFSKASLEVTDGDTWSLDIKEFGS